MATPKHEHKDWLLVYGAAAVLTFIGFFVAYQFVNPAPPDKVTIATGDEGGAYFAYAQRYREFLARHGVELVVRSTAGSVENTRLLADENENVEIAFVQGGAVKHPIPGGLFALGSVYLEPLWIFRRQPSAQSSATTLVNEPVQLNVLAGQRVAIGAEGSGTRTVALTLLEANGLIAIDSASQPEPTENGVKLVDFDRTEVVKAFREGKLDALFLIASVQSPTVLELLKSPGIAPLSFERASAYKRRFRFLSTVSLPAGVIDLEANIPKVDIEMLAPAAILVANERLHPALIDLFLQAAAKVHRNGGIFEAPGEFPSPNFIEYPLSEEARRFYKSGPPFLQRVLPFWAATLVDRLLVMLLPLAALLFPLIRIMPPIYRWRIRSRITRWYRELLAIDAGNSDMDDSTRAHRLAELDRIEGEVSKVHVPASFADQLYHLKVHLKFVRTQLTGSGDSEPEAPNG